MLVNIYSTFTDDSFMTIAIADAFLEHMDKINDPSYDEKLKTLFVKKLKETYHKPTGLSTLGCSPFLLLNEDDNQRE